MCGTDRSPDRQAPDNRTSTAPTTPRARTVADPALQHLSGEEISRHGPGQRVLASSDGEAGRPARRPSHRRAHGAGAVTVTRTSVAEVSNASTASFGATARPADNATLGLAPGHQPDSDPRRIDAADLVDGGAAGRQRQRQDQ